MVRQFICFILLLGGLMSVAAAEIDKTLIQAYEAKGAAYQPRTQHIESNGRPQFINRLILENSPYLIQHAHNPVHWYPWGSDAFEQAKKLDKPIFLSIGYSTCHWCHVMEEESFDNIEIAELMNERFINIKVDREQRPEIDELYMTAVQIMSGQGGWPMSSFLTPEGKSFWGGTYFPPEQFKQLIAGISEAWSQQRQQVEQQADEITQAVKKVAAAEQHSNQLTREVTQQAVKNIMATYDELQGGFSQAPKFPNESLLLLLLDHSNRYDDEVVLEAVETTLDAMARGGVYDHVAGGFHRYATDNAWLIPHFEKMLYNQAYLAQVYLQAYALTKKPFYARIARQTLDYVLRDMTSVEGGFYSATDADSEGEEGKYFLWTVEEVRAALSEQDADFTLTIFGVTEAGNFEGENILYLPETLDSYAKQLALDYAGLEQRVDKVVEQLRLAREKRIAPLRDEKIITAWNAMMISSLSLASEVLAEPRYLIAAERNAQFLLNHNHEEQGQLWRVHLDGTSAIRGRQEDYAYLVEALLALYDQTQNKHYLQTATKLTNSMVALFWDDTAGGFYMNQVSEVPTMARIKQSTDSATPSGNAVAFNGLVMLANRVQNFEYQTKANQALTAFSQSIARYPSAYSYFLLGLNKQLLGEVGTRRYAAHGHVSATIDLVPKPQGFRLILTLDIDDGWHINAHTPFDKDLVATTLELSDIMTWQLDELVYPDVVEKRLGFSQKILALYENQIQITADISNKNEQFTPIAIELSLQACSEQICLAPETLNFKLVK